jgi:hypothetical protein
MECHRPLDGEFLIGLKDSNKCSLKECLMLPIVWRILKSLLPVNDVDTWGPVPKVFVAVYRFEKNPHLIRRGGLFQKPPNPPSFLRFAQSPQAGPRFHGTAD